MSDLFVSSSLSEHLPPWLVKLVCEYDRRMIDCFMCQTNGCHDIARSFGSTGFRCQSHMLPQPLKVGICFRIVDTHGGRAECVGVMAAVETVGHHLWGM
jgi:hypothetical protein